MRPSLYSNTTTGHASRQIGHYKLIELLGQGGFAEVHLGEHIYLHTQVAIKILHPSLTRAEENSFFEEAILAAGLKHPHIIRVLDFGLQDRVPFLVMDYAAHGTMRQRSPAGTRLTLYTLLKYAQQVADALQYIHDSKLIHQDIKPENMLLGSNNELLLSDFGIATTVHKASAHSQVPVGTLAYMAPEQIKGHPCLQSDQYGFGVVVYEWLCGVRPFNGSKREIIQQHLSAMPPSLYERVPGLSPRIEHVVFRALAKDPLDRFESVEAFMAALRNACEPSSIVLKNNIPRYPVQQSVYKQSGIPRYPVQQSVYQPETSKRNQQNLPVRHKRPIWKAVTICSAVDVFVSMALVCILAAHGVTPLLIEYSLALCMVLLQLTGAFISKNKAFFYLTCGITAIVLVVALLCHSLLLFDVVCMSLLLSGFFMGLAVSAN